MRNGNITSWNQIPIVMDLPLVSQILGQTYDCLIKRARNGTLPAFRTGKEWRVTKDDLIKYIEENKNKVK